MQMLQLIKVHKISHHPRTYPLNKEAMIYKVVSSHNFNGMSLKSVKVDQSQIIFNLSKYSQHVSRKDKYATKSYK